MSRQALKIYDLRKDYIKFRRETTPNDPIISRLNGVYKKMDKVEKEMEEALKPFHEMIERLNNEEEELINKFWKDVCTNYSDDIIENIKRLEAELTKKEPRCKAYCSDTNSEDSW